MRKSNYCIQCNNIATLLAIDTPYCTKCYKEIVYVKRKSSKEITRTMRESR